MFKYRNKSYDLTTVQGGEELADLVDQSQVNDARQIALSLMTFIATIPKVPMYAIELVINETEKFPVGGFHTQWLSGKGTTNDGECLEFKLNSGSGMGNPIMSLLIIIDDERHYLTANMAEATESIVRNFVEQRGV